MSWAEVQVIKQNCGVAPSFAKNLTQIVGESTNSLTWEDPEDTIIANQLLTTWSGTAILRKRGSAPASILDGVLVVDNQERNKYSSEPFVDTVLENDWVYKAFPYTENNLHTNNNRNIFSILGSSDEPVPYKITVPLISPAAFGTIANDSIARFTVYTGKAEKFSQIKLDSIETNLMEWSKTFIQKIRPCMVSYTGIRSYYLDPTDLSKKEDGTVSDYDNLAFAGNMMVEVPTIYYNVEYTASYDSCTISLSTEPFEGGQAYAHTMANGSIARYKYYSLLPASFTNNIFRSINIQETVDVSPRYLPMATAYNTTYWANTGSNINNLSLRDQTLLALIGTMLQRIWKPNFFPSEDVNRVNINRVPGFLNTQYEEQKSNALFNYTVALHVSATNTVRSRMRYLYMAMPYFEVWLLGATAKYYSATIAYIYVANTPVYIVTGANFVRPPAPFVSSITNPTGANTNTASGTHGFWNGILLPRDTTVATPVVDSTITTRLVGNVAYGAVPTQNLQGAMAHPGMKLTVSSGSSRIRMAQFSYETI